MTWVLVYHAATVKTLDKADVPMREHTPNLHCVLLTNPLVVMTMKEIGTRVLDDLGVPPEKRRYVLFPEASYPLVYNRLPR